MSVEFTIISIGALSHNRLWGESGAARTAHATTTLVADGEKLILVDPSLPPTVLAARFNERTGRGLADVTEVFCTTLRPVHRRGIAALPEAKWWCGEMELIRYSDHLAELAASADRLNTEDLQAVKEDQKLLERFSPAPEKLTEQVQLFPLLGPSVGSCGLLLTPPTTTVVIAGDAALTAGHVERGQVWAGCADAEAAMESLQSIIEVADVIVPGHDNVMLTAKRWF
ncbi:MAG TPA: MBL fold metallo-hydrolase [Phycisphaerae bacterium]|nr:MBL fold metallo-hydrolase [Phycisphaerae bacterium]